MKKYKLYKSNIYVGRLVKPLSISVERYKKIYCSLSKEEKEQIKKSGKNICCKEIVRPILFGIDDNNLAHDLIYDVREAYPILDSKADIQHKSDFIVEEIINISELLSYLDYKELLTKNDIKRIYNMLILSSKWIKQNIELFGYREIMPGTFVNGGRETINHEIYDTLYRLSIIGKKKPSKDELTRTKSKIIGHKLII